MKRHVTLVATALFVIGWPAFGEDFSKAQPKEQTPDITAITDELIKKANATASANFTAACLNLARDVRDKRLKIYSVVSKAKNGISKENGYTIEVIYHRKLAETYVAAAGSYQQQYNQCLLDFAAAQFAEGQKTFGIQLVRLLAQAEPKLCWGSRDIPSLPIQKILASMESEDGSLNGFFKEATRDWHQRQKDYTP